MSNIPDGLKIAVLYGGIGSERQISLQSGRAIACGLADTGRAEVIEHDYNPDEPQILDDGSIDVFFLAFHGEFGEGGQMQSLCENKGLVFTGCDSRASRLCFDKAACREVLISAGLKAARAVVIDSPEKLDEIKSLSARRFVIKPSAQGSSVGVSLAFSVSEAVSAAKKCFDQFGTTIVEEFIFGREIAVSIVGRRSLPVIEIRTKRPFYDYTAKYDDDATEYLFDTITSPELSARIDNTAMAAFDAAGCRDFARVDMFVTDDGQIYVIEINTIPGFTRHSLLPKAAADVGMDMGQLCMKIVNLAMKRKKIG